MRAASRGRGPFARHAARLQDKHDTVLWSFPLSPTLSHREADGEWEQVRGRTVRTWRREGGCGRVAVAERGRRACGAGGEASLFQGGGVTPRSRESRRLVALRLGAWTFGPGGLDAGPAVPVQSIAPDLDLCFVNEVTGGALLTTMASPQRTCVGDLVLDVPGGFQRCKPL